MKQANFIRTLWGVHIDYSSLNAMRTALQSFKDQGFSGIEVATGFFNNSYKQDFNKIRKELGLSLITQIHTLGYPVPKSNSQEHLNDFKKKIEDVHSWNPDMINVHDGRDDWTLYDSVSYFIKASEFENSLKTDVPIVHETHRQRILNNHKITYDVVKICPNVYFNADISHWVVSAERLLKEDTDENWNTFIDLFGSRCKMIHARIGSPNQIQVIDPTSDENKENREYFHQLWLDIFKKSEERVLNIVLEYGPHPYAINLPNQGNVVDVEKVIQSELHSLQKLFQ
jgi:sugar phosphate isomerase/epimerase